MDAKETIKYLYENGHIMSREHYKTVYDELTAVYKLEERIKALEATLEIFSRPANYESSGIKPPCCEVMVKIANQALKG